MQIEDCIDILHEEIPFVDLLYCWVRFAFTVELYPVLSFANIHINICNLFFTLIELLFLLIFLHLLPFFLVTELFDLVEQIFTSLVCWHRAHKLPVFSPLSTRQQFIFHLWVVCWKWRLFFIVFTSEIRRLNPRRCLLMFSRCSSVDY